jgi:hypothetical protein
MSFPNQLSAFKPEQPCTDINLLLQKIRTDSYTSFSVLGLIIVFTVGGLLIGLGYTLELLAECASKRWRRGTYRRLEWSTNGTLQLQRLAHEEAGWGAWAATTDFVPVAQDGDVLASLDVRDVEHPKLQQRAEGGLISLEMLLSDGNVVKGRSIEQE